MISRIGKHGALGSEKVREINNFLEENLVVWLPTRASYGKQDQGKRQ
jgi:hypothetical protein